MVKKLSYETWQRGRKFISGGTSSIGKLLELLNISVPGLGIVLDLAAKVLGWSLGKIWDSYPHENEPRPNPKALRLYKPGGQPQIPLRQFIEGQPALGTAADTKKLIDTMKEIKAGDEYKARMRSTFTKAGNVAHSEEPPEIPPGFEPHQVKRVHIGLVNLPSSSSLPWNARYSSPVYGRAGF
jgi:hypothetical protein